MVTTASVVAIILTTTIIIMCLSYTSPSPSISTVTNTNDNITHISSPTACKSLTTGEIAEHPSTLAIHARVAFKPLCINIPKKFTQHRDMGDLIASTLGPLGGNRHRIISSPKLQRPNSHNIAVTLEGDSLLWTWPHLSWKDIGSSNTGVWRPMQGANPEGEPSKYIQCNQFCDIANNGGLVRATADSTLQLRFTLPKLSSYIQSSLSPTAPIFNYGANESTPLEDVLSPLAKPFTPEHTNTATKFGIVSKQSKNTLSPLAKAFSPIQQGEPIATNVKQSSDELLSTSTQIVKSTHHEKTVVPIIRHVHFPPESQLVSGVYTRPSTPRKDVPSLYYSALDIKGFKREMRSSGEESDDKPDVCPIPQHPATSATDATTAPNPKEKLHALIDHDLQLLETLGLDELVKIKRGEGDLSSLENVNHPAKRLLKDLKLHGAPIKFSTEPWSREQVSTALARGAHKSCMGHMNFLYEEFEDMIQKGQWLVLPASAVKDWPGLRYSPPGVVEQRERRPRWIVDYSFWGINEETLPLAALESMQFGMALDRILREILLANPEFGPVNLMKVDLSDGFYRIGLNVGDIPKLGVIFPTEPGEDPLVAFPLVLPMGWRNSPPIFSTATETGADLTNQRLLDPTPPLPHPLADRAEQVIPDNPLLSPMPDDSSPSYKDVLVNSAASSGSGMPSAVSIPPARDPSLPSNSKPLSYVDVFVDDFLGLAQEHSNSVRVRRILMHAIDDVFRPLDSNDSPFRRQPISLKKLEKGDCSWSTIKVILGWIIDTVSMTIQLPPHRVERLADILSSIPVTQKRTSVRKWHKVLGELRSMSLALPGARNIFSHMQHAMSSKLKGRVALNKGVHHALDDFRWMLKDIKNRPTRIPELVPLAPSAEGHHDASGHGAGGVWFPSEHLIAREGFDNKPTVWRLKWPQYIIDRLVTSENPDGTISNSDLELAGGLLHLEALSQTFDIRERTVLSKTDNLNTLFWQRKGSATTEKVPAHLLRMFGIHQRFHRYVPRHDYLAGPSNPIADALSRDFEQSWQELFASLKSHLPEHSAPQVWNPSPQVVSAVIAALLKKRQPPSSLLVEPPAPVPSSPASCQVKLQWPSVPLSKPSKTKYHAYKKSDEEFKPENLLPLAIPSGLERLKVTYGSLRRRPLVWGPTTS